jgi:hypothetical protein
MTSPSDTGLPFVLVPADSDQPAVTAHAMFTAWERTSEYDITGAPPVSRPNLKKFQIRPIRMTVHTLDGRVQLVTLHGVFVTKSGADGLTREVWNYAGHRLDELPTWAKTLLERDQEVHHGEDRRP